MLIRVSLCPNSVMSWPNLIIESTRFAASTNSLELLLNLGTGSPESASSKILNSESSAEKEGVSNQVLSAADSCVVLPMDGFVPSYNLQVAVSVVALEALRQRNKYSH